LGEEWLVEEEYEVTFPTVTALRYNLNPNPQTPNPKLSTLTPQP
jgi:hypothetical protein